MLLKRSVLAVVVVVVLVASCAVTAKAGPVSLYVSNGDGKSVLAYNGATGAFQRTFASGGGLTEPEGVVFGPDGNLYVSSRPAQVLKYNGKTGAFLGVFASGHGLEDPAGIAFGGPNNDLYVSSGIPDPPATGGHQILRFDGKTGAFKAVVDPGNAAGLDDPEGMRFGADGLLYVLSTPETGPGEVLRYDAATNTFKDKFVGKSGAGAISDPTDLEFMPGGDLLVSSAASSEVKRYDKTTGAFKAVFVTPGSGGLTEAEGVIFTPDGNLLVASELGNAVLQYNGQTGASLGAFVKSNSGGLTMPTFMIFGPSAATTIPLPPAAISGAMLVAIVGAARARRMLCSAK